MGTWISIWLIINYEKFINASKKGNSNENGWTFFGNESWENVDMRKQADNIHKMCMWCQLIFVLLHFLQHGIHN